MAAAAGRATRTPRELPANLERMRSHSLASTSTPSARIARVRSAGRAGSPATACRSLEAGARAPGALAIQEDDGHAFTPVTPPVITEELVKTRFIAETLLPTRHGKFRLRGYKHSVSGGGGIVAAGLLGAPHGRRSAHPPPLPPAPACSWTAASPSPSPLPSCVGRWRAGPTCPCACMTPASLQVGGCSASRLSCGRPGERGGRQGPPSPAEFWPARCLLTLPNGLLRISCARHLMHPLSACLQRCWGP
jgi:hypothetical protein